MDNGENDNEFMDYLRALADQSRYAGFFEGLTRSRNYPGNKQDKELEVAWCAFPNATSVEPGEDPPDVQATTDQGRIGVEVSELVHRKTLERHARRRSIERKSCLMTQDALNADHRAHEAARAAARAARQHGNDPLEAYVKAYEANRPTPGHVSPNVVADWNASTVANELDRIIQEKDAKLKGRVSGYDEVCLAIHTDETMIDREMALSAKNLRRYKPSHINRVLMVFSYDPLITENDGYLVIEV